MFVSSLVGGVKMEAVSASKEMLLLKSNTVQEGIELQSCDISNRKIDAVFQPSYYPWTLTEYPFDITISIFVSPTPRGISLYLKMERYTPEIDMEPKKSPDWTGISSSKPPSLCSMSIFRGVSFFSPFGVQLGLLELLPRKMLWLRSFHSSKSWRSPCLGRRFERFSDLGEIGYTPKN